MPSRKARSSDEYDGPTLNGHPPLSVAETQAWFRAAGCTSDDQTVLPLVQMLNEYEFFGSFWKPAFKDRRNKNESYLRHVRVASALKTLQADLLIIIEDTRNISPQAQSSEGLRSIRTLLDSVVLVAPRFQQFLPSRGRKADLWHNIARKLADQIRTIFKANGHRFGFGKTTSPGIQVLQGAFAYLGVHNTSEAIVDALRPQRTRPPQ